MFVVQPKHFFLTCVELPKSMVLGVWYSFATASQGLFERLWTASQCSTFKIIKNLGLTQTDRYYFRCIPILVYLSYLEY